MMPVTNSFRSLWILLFSIVVLGLLFAGATKDVSSETTSAADEVPAPVLYDIDNADGDGNYMIEWSAVPDVDDYRLRENIDGSASWELVYKGTDTSFSRSNMPDGQYCYHVRALKGTTLSPWSEDKCTTVGEPPPGPTSTSTPTVTSTPTATATQQPPTGTPTGTNTPAPTSSSTPAPSPTATPRPIVNLPIIVYQLPPTPTPTATVPPTPSNTPVPTNTPSPTPTPVPLFVGLGARWDGRGFIRIGDYYENGWHQTLDFTEMVDNDIIKSENRSWYDPNPLDLDSEEWDSFYSISTGSLKSSSRPGDPAFKWGYYRILPYRFAFKDGEVVEFLGQKFRASGPYNGTGAFGQHISYWRLVNQETFLFGDWGDGVSQYVHPGDAILEYDIDTRLLLENDILRHYYVDGDLTPYTVQYIVYLTSSNAYPVQQLRFAPEILNVSIDHNRPYSLSLDMYIPKDSLLPGP